jgi:hypothetical protein
VVLAGLVLYVTFSGQVEHCISKKNIILEQSCSSFPYSSNVGEVAALYCEPVKFVDSSADGGIILLP